MTSGVDDVLLDKGVFACRLSLFSSFLLIVRVVRNAEIEFFVHKLVSVYAGYCMYMRRKCIKWLQGVNTL